MEVVLDELLTRREEQARLEEQAMLKVSALLEEQARPQRG